MLLPKIHHVPDRKSGHRTERDTTENIIFADMEKILIIIAVALLSVKGSFAEGCICPSINESEIQVTRKKGIITIIQNSRYSSFNDYIGMKGYDAGHCQRIKEFGSLITPEIKTEVSRLFYSFGIEPGLVSIVINAKGNIEALELIFIEKEDVNALSDSCAIEVFFRFKELLAFPAWDDGMAYETMSFPVFYDASH